jgi:hypothetical protein
MAYSRKIPDVATKSELEQGVMSEILSEIVDKHISQFYRFVGLCFINPKSKSKEYAQRVSQSKLMLLIS